MSDPRARSSGSARELAAARSATPRLALTSLLAAGGVLALALHVVPRPFALRLLDERGPMEIASLLAYAATLALLAWRSRSRAAAWAGIALVFLAIAEIDPRGWISAGVGSPRPGGGAPRPPVHPIALLLILGGALAIAVGLAREGARPWVRALRRSRAWAWLVLAGVMLLSMAVGVDRFQDARFNWERGDRIERGAYFATHVAEEAAEFLVPLVFLVAVLSYRKGSYTVQEPPS